MTTNTITKKVGAPSPAKNTAHPVTNTQVETRMTVNTQGSVSSPNITSPTPRRRRPSPLDQLLGRELVALGDLCTSCGRRAQILVGSDRVKYCGHYDDDPHAHGADEALTAALAEGHEEIIDFLTQVPAATMVAALCGLARRHPDDPIYADAMARPAALVEAEIAGVAR